MLEATLLDEELNDVFEARAEPGTADWNVEGRHVMRSHVSCLGQQVRQCPAVGVELNVRTRSAVCLSDVVEP